MKFSALILLIMLLLALTACNLNAPNTPQSPAFTKQVEVFGLYIYATNTTSDDKLLHAANILAQYIDNDEDGLVDNPKILKALLDGRGSIVMRKTEGENITGARPKGQGLYDEETIPDSASQDRFDASLEEILHMVTDIGWAGAYPDAFDRQPGTKISNALDKARGGVSKLKLPIYAAHCEDDDHASPASLRFLQRKSRHTGSRFQIFPTGGHGILAAHGEDHLYGEIVKFCRLKRRGIISFIQ